MKRCRVCLYFWTKGLYHFVSEEVLDEPEWPLFDAHIEHDFIPFVSGEPDDAY